MSGQVLTRRSLVLLAALVLPVALLAGCGGEEEPPPTILTEDEPAPIFMGWGDRLAGLVDSASAEEWQEAASDVAAADAEERVVLGEGMVAVNLTPDFWTTGAPAGILLRNAGEQPFVPELPFVTYAPGERPVVTVITPQSRRDVRLDEGKRLVQLPAVAPGEERLVLVTTDRTWVPGDHDPRQLGVQILPTERMGDAFSEEELARFREAEEAERAAAAPASPAEEAAATPG